MQIVVACPTHIHELFSIGRSLVQTVLAVVLFHVATTFVWWVGVCLIILGSAVYWLTHKSTYNPGLADNKDDIIPVSVAN